MKYYLIAGEASGDLHASNLMRSLKKQDTDAEFRFFGGDSRYCCICVLYSEIWTYANRIYWSGSLMS